MRRSAGKASIPQLNGTFCALLLSIVASTRGAKVFLAGLSGGSAAGVCLAEWKTNFKAKCGLTVCKIVGPDGPPGRLQNFGNYRCHLQVTADSGPGLFFVKGRFLFPEAHRFIAVACGPHATSM